MPNRPPYKFQPPVVAQNDNRVTTQGQAPISARGRANLRVVNVIPAASGTTPGTLNVPAYGTQFYFRVLTAEISVKPKTGVFSKFNQGEGQNFSIENTFDMLQLRNDNTFAVVFEMVVGFDDFIDNKLILSNSINTSVAFPTTPTPNVATNININDLSGTLFTDINGKNWYALARTAIVITNFATGVNLLLQKAGSVVSNGPAVMGILANSVIRIDLSGNYCLNVGGGTINATVCELYQAIAA
jgi:hypothetical protein